MRKLVLVGLILALTIPAMAQETITANEKAIIQKSQLIQKLERVIEKKEEEKRIAISTVKTIYDNELDVLETQYEAAKDALQVLLDK